MTEETPLRIIPPLSDLRCKPKGPRDRQLIFGTEVTRLGLDGAWAYVRSARDGYVGYVLNNTLGAPVRATHIVCAPTTHVYANPNLKSRDHMGLTHLSRLTSISETDGFLETSDGFVPQQHVRPVDEVDNDPAKIAHHYLGTDYLWGGNSRWGIDCSGLVQAALLACGIPCPGDSDQQLTLGAPASGPYQRNDLLFWKGHVALVTDPDTLIHANAHSMSVIYEPIKDAITRIANKGDGPVTAHRRL